MVDHQPPNFFDSTAAYRQYFDKPSELEIEYLFFQRFRGKFCGNFYMRKKKWEKRKNTSNGAGDRICWLHRSPKYPCTSDSCLVCFFTFASTRVCQNMRYWLRYHHQSAIHTIFFPNIFSYFSSL